MNYKPFAIGIDESNMGRWPRVYVAVGSRFKNDIKPTNLEDKLRKEKRTVRQLLNGRPFWHMLVYPGHLASAGCEESLKYVILRTFVDAYMNDNRSPRNVETVIMDGTLAASVEDFFHKDYHDINLIVKPQADLTYPVVYLADAAANVLMDVHVNKDRGKNAPTPAQFADTLIQYSPYAKRLRELNSKKT